MTIGFADLVGFTSLGEALPPEKLEQVSQRLADLTRELAVAPARFIRTIGDDGRFTWPFAGAKHLKGIKPGVEVYRARRTE